MSATLAAVAACFAAAVLTPWALAEPATAEPERRPALRVVSVQPIQARGSGWKPKARVRVTATVGESRVARRVVASARGTFVVRLPLSVARCDSASVTAIARGASVTWRKLPAPQCPPPEPGALPD